MPDDLATNGSRIAFAAAQASGMTRGGCAPLLAERALHGLLRAMGGYVYILASRKNGTLYTGVTSDLERRTWEHREGLVPGFTSKYGVKPLVWYRDYHDIRDAIDDEKRIKRWRRKWKLELIEAMNPKWDDLGELLGR